jgi:hypothetical protein
VCKLRKELFLGKWSILEDKINSFLIWFYSMLKSVVLKITPIKVKTFISNSISKTKEFISLRFLKVKMKMLNFFGKILNSLTGSKVFFRESLRSIIQKLDQLKKINFKNINIKEKLLSIKSSFISKLQSSDNIFVILYQKIGPQNVRALSILLFIGVLSLSQIYTKSKKILISTGVVRAPASTPKAKVYPKTRPAYYKRNERQLYIRDLRFPVYVESKSSSKSLTMDITVITSNKYTRAYLNENHFIVKDAFNSRIEPIIPSFPLEAEGKIILKTKIEKELNKLIKKYKIDGKVENVHIHAITAG